MTRYSGVLIGIVASCLLPVCANADQVRVVVSEVNWGGSVSSVADEWLELNNAGTETIDLSGWSLWNVAGEPKEQLRIAMGEIPANGSFLIANNGPDYAFSGGASTLAVTPDLVAGGLSLSNSVLNLELRNAAGEVVDRVGDGSKPAAGSTDPIASMERLLGQPGTGAKAIDWRTSAERSGFDEEVTQFGTPTSSGRSQEPAQPASNQSSESAPVATASIPRTTLESVVRRSVSGQVRIQAQVLVSEQNYKDRTVIIADGEWSAELLLPDPSLLRLQQGDVVDLLGKVSTGNTPKVLLGKDTDLMVVSSRSAWSPLALERLVSPRLFQVVRLSGRANPIRGSIEVVTNDRTVKVTRRQGVLLPDIQADDTVLVTGLVVAEDPLTVRVVDDDAVVMTTEVAEDDSSTSNPIVAQIEVDDEISDATGIAVDESTEELGGLTNEATDTLLTESNELAEESLGQQVASATVLGAMDIRNADTVGNVSLVVAVGSLCGILLILGDSVWMYLKQKQQQ